MPTIGEILRTEREKLGLSIKDIEKETCIRSLYLTAIEEGNYTILPGEVYLKGFIRNYANFIGLDGQAMVELYREQQTEHGENPPESLASTNDQKIEPSLPPKSKTSLNWVLIFTVLVGIGGAGFWYISGNPQPAQPKSPSSIGNTSKTPSLPPADSTKPAPKNQQQTKTKPQAPVNVTVKFLELCWTSVQVDGKEVFEDTPKIGDSLTWQAQREIIIKFGDADAIEVTHNGKTLGKLGKDGEVIQKTFTSTP